MGGQEGSRGYIYQAIASIFHSFLENDWDSISVEYLTEKNKVDIALMNGKDVIKAFQVKSSVNLFNKDDIIMWIEALETDINARKYCLTIIGSCENNANIFIKSTKKFYESTMDKESSLSINGYEKFLTEHPIEITLLPFDESSLLGVIRDSIHRYVSSKGYTIDFPILEQLSLALISLQMLFGTKGKIITRLDYENKIFEWLNVTLDLKNHGHYSEISVLAFKNENQIFEDAFKVYSISNLPSLVLYRDKIIHEGKKLIDEICSIELPVVDKGIVEYTIEQKKMYKLFNGETPDLDSIFKAEMTDKNKKDMSDYIKEYWDIDVTNDFFYLGCLTKLPYLTGEIKYEGSDTEKKKNMLLINLLHNILLLKCIRFFTEALKDVLILPLCIKNIGNYADSNISIIIPSISENYYLFNFGEHVCTNDKEKLNSIADTLIQEEIIEKIFEIKANAYISVEPQIYCSPQSYFILNPFSKRRKYNLEDLIKAMSVYKAEESSPGIVTYEIQSIRPAESIWLAPYLMLISKKKEFNLNYTILSENSGKRRTGTLIVFAH